MSLDVPTLRAALEAGPEGEGCPAPATLLAALEGGLAPAAAQALLDHAAGCGSCALALRLAREGAADNVAVVRPRRLRFVAAVLRPRRLRFIAAALAAAAAVALVPLGLRRSGEEALRGDARPAIRSTTTSGPLPRADFRLRWTGLASARYDVVVATPDLHIVFSAQALSDPALLVPAKALAALPPGQRLLFTVTAVLPDGRRVISGALKAQLAE